MAMAEQQQNQNVPELPVYHCNVCQADPSNKLSDALKHSSSHKKFKFICPRCAWVFKEIKIYESHFSAKHVAAHHRRHKKNQQPKPDAPIKLAIWLLSKGTGPAKMSEAKQAKVATCYATVLMVLYHELWTVDAKDYFRGMSNQELKFYRIRLIVLALHDARDVFMEAAKVLKYSEKELAASVLLVGFFARSWFILLLISFSWVIRNASYDLIEFSVGGLPSEITTTGFVLMLNIHIIESFYRIDFIVLALHDASDVFMEAAKVLKYSEKELAASVLFGFFVLSWFILRLIFFPFWVIRNRF